MHKKMIKICHFVCENLRIAHGKRHCIVAAIFCMNEKMCNFLHALYSCRPRHTPCPTFCSCKQTSLLVKQTRKQSHIDSILRAETMIKKKHLGLDKCDKGVGTTRRVYQRERGVVSDNDKT
jgi:hypothetical protein